MSAAAHSEFRRSVEEFAGALGTKPLLRAVNFHSTPRNRAAEYREQLMQWGKRFSAVSEDDLDRYLASGQWHKPKPGLIIALYDASRNGYDVILPLIEEAGLIGWYFVLTGFVTAAPAAQLAYAAAHDIAVQAAEYPGGRQALSWNELRDIEKRGHVVASHARSHISLRELSESDRESEVLGSQLEMKDHLGHPVRTFVSYGGPAYGEHLPSDALIDKAGYQFVFSNLKIQRLRDWKRVTATALAAQRDTRVARDGAKGAKPDSSFADFAASREIPKASPLHMPFSLPVLFGQR